MASESCPIWVVDAFASGPFTGNPAGVCLLPHETDAQWMQSIAAEMNHAESAFVVRGSDGFGLRWFTPELEVDLCGHATLAAAHVLWEAGWLQQEEQARFWTRSGLLECRLLGGAIAMDFPNEMPVRRQIPSGATAAIGAPIRWCGANRLDWLFELDSEESVRAMQPVFDRVEGLGRRCVIVTALSELPGTDFVSRVFAPSAGILEDPVTGSAHCALAPFWAERLGRTNLVGYQASARGGTVRTSVREERVELSGKAQTFLRGELMSAPPHAVPA